MSNLITKGLKAITAAINPVTMADATRVYGQITNLSNLAGGRVEEGSRAFHGQAAPLIAKFKDMQAAQDLPRLPTLASYTAERASEARKLADAVADLRSLRAGVVSDLASFKSSKAKPLDRLERAAAEEDQALLDLAETLAKAKDARAAAYGEAVENGTHAEFNGAKHDTAIKKAADALAGAQDRHAVVHQRLEALRAELQRAEQDADARTQALDVQIRKAEQAVNEQAVDTAAGLYVLAVADLSAEALPDFALQVFNSARVPFAVAGERSVTWEHISRDSYYRDAMNPADWVAEVEASGLLEAEWKPIEWKDGARVTR